MESRLQSRLLRPKTTVKTSLRQRKEKFAAFKTKATADEAILQEQLMKLKDTILSMEQNFERRLKTQLLAAKQKAAIEQAQLAAKLDEAEKACCNRG